MHENTVGAQVGKRYWVGIDWGKTSHAVSIVDDDRSLVESFKVSMDLDGFVRLVEKLRARLPIGGIAIEATRNLVVARLFEEGFNIYPINPKLSKNWRDGISVAGVKSDERDGHVLAVELARRHESLLRLEKADPVVEELMALCETVRSLIGQRTALVQRLRETLYQYYPAALDFFSSWTSPAAWRFLKRFPRPETLARAQKTTLIKFLKANRIGLKPIWLRRIERRGEAADWPTTAYARANETMAMASVAQLLALQAHISKLEHLIEEQTETLPQNDLIRTLPGAGKQLVPVLTAITAGVEATHGGYQALRCLTGVAPVTEQSGRKSNIHIRRRCNKHWRNEMHLFAFCSISQCSWAKAFYDLCKARGDSHATALRKLADKWLKIIMRMIQTGKPYDDEKYVQCLRKHNSPAYSKLREQRCA